jgi:hypothetical protein
MSAPSFSKTILIICGSHVAEVAEHDYYCTISQYSRRGLGKHYVANTRYLVRYADERNLVGLKPDAIVLRDSLKISPDMYRIIMRYFPDQWRKLVEREDL